MKKLNSNWFVEGVQDFEYKQYILLAYLQWVKTRFDQSLLFPEFQDLIQHYNDLHLFQQGLTQMKGQFPREVQGIDVDAAGPALRFTTTEEGTESLREVEEIVDYSIPQVKTSLEEGRELYEFIEGNIEIDTVGLLPLDRDAGYLLFRRGNEPEVKAYAYHVTIFEQAQERYRGIHTEHVCNFTYSLGNTYESIKLDLVRQNRHLPNPATYAIYSRLAFPLHESLEPVAKRKFMRYLAQS